MFIYFEIEVLKKLKKKDFQFEINQIKRYYDIYKITYYDISSFNELIKESYSY